MAEVAIASAFTALSVIEGKKQQKAAEEAQDEQKAAARAQATNEKKKQLRAARIKRAQAVNQAAISGGEGSILSGATNSATQQSAVNIGNINEQQGFQERAFDAQRDASRYAARSSLFGSVGGLATSMIGKDIFGTTTQSGGRQAPISTSQGQSPLWKP